jgi:hypothetical protein
MSCNVHWASLAMAALLSGCGMMPYELPPDADTAKLNLKTAGRAWICASGKGHSLDADESGYAIIPAGSRIVVGSSYFASGYNVNYSCAPRISFIPLKGMSYYQDFQIEAERCTSFVYRETDANPTGLALEPSMAVAGGCKGSP